MLARAPAVWLITPVGLVDLFPTLADLCDVPQIAGCDGASLRPFMENAAAEQTRPVVSTWQKGNHSLRQGDWRYTRYHDGSDELYNQASDPHEWTNLAGKPEYEGIRHRLSDKLRNVCP